uniref:Ribosomal protein eL8/eL30/eS12/Gadd45 domain-containing protein n=1 Tax=Xiphophorus couchianus TaxID=32473 RepID=A0A3B5LD82_9TELE
FIPEPEELRGLEAMKSPGKSLKEALVCAQSEHRLTVGVYESAKIMTEDPDNVSFCVLATDEQFEWDVALQIHFTLIQSFCFDNDISIVRVSDTQRLAAIVGDEQEDAHCVLITVRAGGLEQPALSLLQEFRQKCHFLKSYFRTLSLKFIVHYKNIIFSLVSSANILN